MIKNRPVGKSQLTREIYKIYEEQKEKIRDLRQIRVQNEKDKDELKEILYNVAVCILGENKGSLAERYNKAEKILKENFEKIIKI